MRMVTGCLYKDVLVESENTEQLNGGGGGGLEVARFNCCLSLDLNRHKTITNNSLQEKRVYFILEFVLHPVSWQALKAGTCRQKLMQRLRKAATDWLALHSLHSLRDGPPTVSKALPHQSLI